MAVRNKKKLRRIERLSKTQTVTPENNKSMHGLVLAGMLAGGLMLATPGMVGNAAAADTFKLETHSYTNAVNITTEQFKIVSSVAYTFGGKLTVSGSSNGNYYGLNGYTANGTTVGKVIINGGVDVQSGGGIHVSELTIKDGGASTVSGHMSPYNVSVAKWRAGSMLLGMDAVTVSGTGTTLTLGSYGQLVTGTTGTLTITDKATVNMSGSSGEAALLRASTVGANSGKLVISAGGKVHASGAGYATIDSNNTLVTGAGSAIKVDSGSHLMMRVGLTESANSGAQQATDVGLTFEGGTLSLKDGGRVYADKATFKAGTLLIDGGSGTGRSGLVDNEQDLGSSEYIFGTAADAGPTVTLTNGGGIEGQSINVSGGTFTLSGKGSIVDGAGEKVTEWRQGSLIGASSNLTISGGKVDVEDWGQLLAYTGGTLAISGGEVNLKATTAGSAAMLRASQVQSNLASGAASFTIGGGATAATVNVTGYGRMLGEKIDVAQSGSINVNGGHLLVTNDDRTNADALPGTFDNAYALQVLDTNLNIRGGTVTVLGDAQAGSGGEITVSDGTLKVTGNLDSTKGDLSVSGGDVVVGGTTSFNDAALTTSTMSGSFTTGALNLSGEGSTLTVNGGADLAFTGLGTEKTFFNGSKIEITSGGNLYLGSSVSATKGGTYGNKVHVASGSLSVGTGNWSLTGTGDKGTTVDASGVIDVHGGSLNVADLNIASSGKMNVSGGTSLATLKTDKLTTVSGNQAHLNVGNLGVLEANLSDFGTVDANGGLSGGTALSQINVVGSGILKLTSDGSVPSLTLTNTRSLIDKLRSGDGLVDFSPALSVTLESGDFNSGGALDGTVDNDKLSGLGIVLTDQSVGVRGASGAATVGGGFGVQNVVVNDTAALGGAITLGVSGDLTLTGGVGTSLVEARDENGQAVAGTKTNIEVAAGKSLTLGYTGADQAGGGVLNGNITMGTGSAATSGNLSLVNGTFEVRGDIDATNLSGGSITLASATVAVNTLDMSGTTSGNLSLSDSSLALTTLKADASDTIAVGDATNRGILTAGNVELNGATIVFDPEFGAHGDTSNASLGALNFASATVDGTIIVGQNSMVTIGSTNTDWLSGQIDSQQNSGNVLWGDNVTAALAIRGAQTLGATNSGIKVDGDVTTTNPSSPVTHNSVTFGEKSLFVVDAPSLNGKAALSASGGTGGTATMAGSAKLMLADAQGGNTYKVLHGFGTATMAAGSWTGSNLLSSSYLQVLTLNSAADDVSVSVAQLAAAETLPGISSSMAGLVDSLYTLGMNNTQSSNAGVKFVTRATDRLYMPLANAAKTLEGAAQMALAGGAPGVSLNAVAASTGAVAQRTNVSAPLTGSAAPVGLGGGDGNQYAFGVWAMPLYQNSNVKGMDAGSFSTGYDSNLYGGIVGADVTNGNFRMGIAFNLGTGDADSTGDFASTKNDFDFWGTTLYAGYRLNNFAVSADFGYTSMKNEIKQDLASSMNMGGQLKSDVDADIYSLGVKAEYLISTSVVDITPNVGIRYNAYRQDSYSVGSNAGDVFQVDKADMDTWTFPIGVSFSKAFELGEWEVKPQLDLRYIPAAGDLDIKHNVRIPGTPVTPASLTGDVVDRNTGEVGVGLNLRRDNISLGLNYNYQGSANRDAHGVFGTFRYEF